MNCWCLHVGTLLIILVQASVLISSILTRLQGVSIPKRDVLEDNIVCAIDSFIQGTNHWEIERFDFLVIGVKGGSEDPSGVNSSSALRC